jgi:hypothetical protein
MEVKRVVKLRRKDVSYLMLDMSEVLIVRNILYSFYKRINSNPTDDQLKFAEELVKLWDAELEKIRGWGGNSR